MRPKDTRDSALAGSIHLRTSSIDVGSFLNNTVLARAAPESADALSDDSSSISLENPYWLVLTGERPRNRFLVHIHERPVWLTGGAFDLLIRLIIARSGPGTGFIGSQAGIYPIAIYRLRKLIDQAYGAHIGKTVVETGAVDEYRLGFPINHVGFATSFWELPIPDVLSHRQAEQLRQVDNSMKSQR